MVEQWKRIPGYEQLYAVSSWGRVLSLRYKKLMKLREKTLRKSYSYLAVEFQENNLRKKVFVHYLVLLAFRGSRPPGKQSRHLDGDPLNNHLSNLCWGTWSENHADRHKHRKSMVLTEADVRYIRSSTRPIRALAEEVGCSKSMVAYVRNRQAWKHLP